ncbi:MAG: hypothetical protein VYB22_08285, partial [Pseudomonadota bacterium]|nr:hypothetical protein [Pseudomonadota bacterium]
MPDHADSSRGFIKQHFYNRSIKSFLLSVSIFFSALGFLLIYLAADQVNKASIKTASVSASQELVQVIFQGVQLIQQHPWTLQEVDEYLNKIERQHPAYQVNINFLDHTPIVNAAAKNLVANQTQFQTDASTTALRFEWPLMNNGLCSDCPQSVFADKPLAVISISHDLSKLMDSAEEKLMTN